MNLRVLVVATSKKTRGGITSVVKAHSTGPQWKSFSCVWIQTHRDSNALVKVLYFVSAIVIFVILVPFFDIVHIHSTADSSAKRKLIFAKIAHFFRKKVIVHFHPSNPSLLENEYSKSCLAKLFDMSDLVIVLSPFWKQKVYDAFGENRYNVKVLLNPCPKVSLPTIERKKWILFSGSIIQRKGYPTLLKAFSLISNDFPGWRLVFAGNGELDNLKDIASDLKIADRIDCLGWVNGSQKNYVYSSSSILCLASTGEGFPMAILDALAYKVPCITTPVGGLLDYFTDGKDAMFFDVGDYVALSEKLRALMSDDSLRKAIVENADKLAKGPFSIEQVNSSLADIYCTVSGKK